MKAYIGIDNGVTGSIAFIGDGNSRMFRTPTHKEQSYTKKKAQITRIDWMGLEVALANLVDSWGNSKYIRVLIERPYVNPKGFKATASALRSLEATLIAVERYGLSYEYIDSKQWQKVMLPKGCKGDELKAASKDIGIRLFPEHKEIITKQKDADSLLIAEWARRMDL